MRQALGQRVSIARVDRGAVMRYGRWALMRPPCSAALMRPLCVRPECPAFLYPGVGAAGYSSQTHGEVWNCWRSVNSSSMIWVGSGSCSSRR